MLAHALTELLLPLQKALVLGEQMTVRAEPLGGVLAAQARWCAESGRVIPVYFIGVGEKLSEAHRLSQSAPLPAGASIM